MSFREMGNIYYKREDYKNAYFNYDSAIVYIDPNIASFAELEEKHAGLSTLVANMLLVEREDSLQRLATMSEPVLFAYLDGIIKEKIEDEKKQSVITSYSIHYTKLYDWRLGRYNCRFHSYAFGSNRNCRFG